MRFRRLRISNFKAITGIDLDNLSDVVVVAGPNGCGKSCVFDAIRLLKSAYGGYQPNEVDRWFGEFQIEIKQGERDLLALFQDKKKPVHIRVEIELSTAEREYLKRNARRLVQAQAWGAIVPQTPVPYASGGTPLATNLRRHKTEVDKRTEKETQELRLELRKNTFIGDLVIEPDLRESVRTSRVLELIFSVYEPQHIGIVDYHGPHRNYAREQIGGINLNTASSDQTLRNAALYDYANKYSNLKSELASGYIRQLIAKELNSGAADFENLTRTLAELFETFFPGKEFRGPQPTSDGRLLFQVSVGSGQLHDINELSSGEKEVLYGYLRIRNAAPRSSVLLIDEPELHLNPRLIRSLLKFYHKHLGTALENQLWLLTHSDALLREAVGGENCRVFHMLPPGATNQMTEVVAAKDVERVVIDLVGDLATYRPGAKVVIFEGGGDTEFDLRMSCTLFPAFHSTVNAISAGNKVRVRHLHDVLEKAWHAGQLPMKVYSICDRDFDEEIRTIIPTRLQWDAYHIENYLLVDEYIKRVLVDLKLTAKGFGGEREIEGELRECAEETVPDLVRHEMELHANKLLVGTIHTASDRKPASIASALTASITSSAAKFQVVVTRTLTRNRLEKLEQELFAKRKAALRSGLWRRDFRGRNILRRFVAKHAASVRYEEFRNLIIARMRDDSYQPPGMKVIIEKLLSDPLK